MKRRELLKYTALASGTAVFAPLASSILAGCGRKPVEDIPNYQPEVFTTDQFKLVTDMADIILPRTDTPGASDVGVPQTIDSIVGNVYEKADQEQYKAGMTSLERFMGEAGYTKMTPEEKLGFLRDFETGNLNGPEGVVGAYMHLRQQIIAFYLSSEAIAENQLNYLPVPGEYEPCITLEEAGGKAWAI
ncbi:gluconate 2-dehydrogenase subunit 3 family protein [Fulvivirga sedimenti]|uniref:Gluconate 2-dehydrogenase subunit 3 family protein n=1 Tax=Fulvivirga sedimenti TaxID=2879465 RepID=A0A9X1HWV7_9BACT|nr:gluconate 2-dehydrogenase subunit 3 family protein [Fulvivirga sedimenti]MCA6079121.1 gluconate 2-dehydrogenase subunit 3 family protein [Fulvivirga sedimenti]